MPESDPEIEVDEALARQLIRERYPELEVDPLRHHGATARGRSSPAPRQCPRRSTSRCTGARSHPPHVNGPGLLRRGRRCCVVERSGARRAPQRCAGRLRTSARHARARGRVTGRPRARTHRL